MAILPGAWRYRVSTGTGRPGVSILWLGEVERLICNFYLSVAARQIVWADPSLRYTSMLLGRKATNQQTIVARLTKWTMSKRCSVTVPPHDSMASHSCGVKEGFIQKLGFGIYWQCCMWCSDTASWLVSCSRSCILQDCLWWTVNPNWTKQACFWAVCWSKNPHGSNSERWPLNFDCLFD